MLSRFATVAAAVLAMASSSAQADVRFTFETTDPSGAENINALIVQNGNFRMGLIALNDRDIDGDIMFRPGDGEGGTLYVQDEGREMMRFGAGGPSMAGMAAGDGMDVARMPGLTAEQRAGLEQALRQVREAREQANGDPSPRQRGSGQRQRQVTLSSRVIELEISNSADTLRASGFDIHEGGGLRWRVWVADPAELGNGAEVYEAFAGFSDFLDGPGIPPRLRDGLFLFDVDAFNGGIPVGFDEFDTDGEVVRLSRLIGFSCADIPLDYFHPGFDFEGSFESGNISAWTHCD